MTLKDTPAARLDEPTSSTVDDIAAIERAFLAGDLATAQRTLSAFFQSASSAAERETRSAALVARIDHDNLELGAMLALGAGALVEKGADPRALARAVTPQLKRALTLCSEDKSAHASLATWYRPAVASWCRDIDALREAQADQDLADGLDLADDDILGVHWLRILTSVLFQAPFIALFPETQEAHAFTLSGCVDAGQLQVLLASSLGDALSRVGVVEVPSATVVDVMTGKGPQKGEGGYQASWHLHPWQALDADTRLPKDDVFMWTSPGGSGTGPLPGDFLPGDIEPMHGARVVVITGPRQGRFRRGLGASRTFGPLQASVTDVKALPTYEASLWMQRALDGQRA